MNKKISQKIAFGVLRGTAAIVVMILLIILGFIFYKGFGVISLDFLFSYPEEGMTSGGIWPGNSRNYILDFRIHNCSFSTRSFVSNLFE